MRMARYVYPWYNRRGSLYFTSLICRSYLKLIFETMSNFAQFKLSLLGKLTQMKKYSTIVTFNHKFNNNCCKFVHNRGNKPKTND